MLSRADAEGLINAAKVFKTKGFNVKVGIVNKDLTLIDLRGLNLSESDLRYTDFRGAQMEGTEFDRSDLSHAKVLKKDYEKHYFAGAKTDHIEVY